MNQRRIYIELNNKCNFNCKFCPYSLQKLENTQLSLTQVKSVLLDIKENINYRIIYFHNISEPLLYPFIDEVIKCCDENGIRYGMTTNGYLLDKKYHIFVNSKIQELNISYQTIDDNLLELRGINCTSAEYLKRISSGINKLLDNKFNAEIKIKLLSTNSRSYFNGNKIKSVYNHRLLIKEVDKINFAIFKKHLEKYQIKKLRKISLKNFCKIHLASNVFVEIFPFLTWGNAFDKVHKASYGTCDGINEQLLVKSDGYVSPCCYSFGCDLVLGNINSNSLSDILKSDITKAMLKKIEDNKVELERCKQCLGEKSYLRLKLKERKFLRNKQKEKRFIFSNNFVNLGEEK